MTDDITPESAPIPSTQALRERISDLEEEVGNLRRLHLTIERNNNLFEALLASSTDGIALTQLDGTLIRIVSPIVDYGNRGLSGMSVYDFVHPEDRQTVSHAYQQFSAGAERQIVHEFRLMRRDGSCLWVHSTMTDMLDNPAVQAIVLNYRNITELRAGELASAELQAIIRYSPFAVFSKSVTGEILNWNDGAKAIFGYEQEEIVGHHIWTLVPVELREEEQRKREGVVNEKTSAPAFRTVRIHKNGTHIPIELVLSPLVTGDRVHGIAHLSYPLGAG